MFDPGSRGLQRVDELAAQAAGLVAAHVDLMGDRGPASGDVRDGGRLAELGDDPGDTDRCLTDDTGRAGFGRDHPGVLPAEQVFDAGDDRVTRQSALAAAAGRVTARGGHTSASVTSSQQLTAHGAQ